MAYLRRKVHHRQNSSGTALGIVAAVIVVAIVAWALLHPTAPTTVDTKLPAPTEQTTPAPDATPVPPVTEEQETPLPTKKPDNSSHVNEPLVPHKDW